MSWFESATFASIAKNALKEAQRTIDKALDIKEQEISSLEPAVNPQIKDNLKKETQNFFASFGLPEDNFSKVKASATDGNLVDHAKDENAGGVVGSLWGSFTGSFFENPKTGSGKGFSKSSSAPETPSDSIIETQPPRACGNLAKPSSGSTVGSNSSSSIVQLSQDAITPIQDSVELAGATFPLDEGLLPQEEVSSKSREWGWDAWGSNSSSIMVMASDLQLENDDSFAGAEDPHEESLVDDSLDHDGFARSRLVVRSVESDKTLRHESLGSLTSTRSQADVDPLQMVSEEDFCDPFEDESEGPNLHIGLADVNPKVDDSSLLSLPFNTPNSPDSIVTLPSSEISPAEDVDFGVPKLEIFPSNNEVPSLPNVCSSDSVELIDSNGAATSSSIEVLSTSSTNDSPPANKSCQNSGDISSIATPGESCTAIAVRIPEKDHDIPAITKQPIASILPQAFARSTSDSPQSQEHDRMISSQPDIVGASTFLEDSSACDSIHSASTSSTLTAIDTSISAQETLVASSFPESPAKTCENVVGISSKDPSSSVRCDERQQPPIDDVGLEASKAPAKTNEEALSGDNVRQSIEKEYLSSSLMVGAIYKSREDSLNQGELFTGLESSTRSESSTETVTTSVDSQHIWCESISLDEEATPAEELVSKDLPKEAEVKDLIQEAMTEDKPDSPQDAEQKSEGVDARTVASQEREQSPSSSEKSDFLKMSSEHTSGHSSADEVETETATSSDIEVISSPSMDGSNGNSRGFGPTPGIASKIWGSAQRGFKAILNEAADSSASNSSGKRDNGNNGFHDRETVASSMTTSITSISESEGDGFLVPTAEFLQMENSRISQALLKEFTTYEKGHRRNQSNISETSESSSDLQSPETDKLLKKLAQVTEILQARETKLIELSHANASMQETNHSLKLRLEELEASKRGVDATESVREEFTQRLVAMERKFQQALREKEAAKKQLEECKAEAASMLSSAEIFRELEEKETVIKELREEGEKLSKQERQHLNIIKKLRTKEKETDACVKSQKEKIEAQCHEVERLQKQLSAKEEVERSQIDAIRKLTIANERQENEMKELSASNSETEGKCATLKEALDATYREIAELKRVAAAHDAEAQERALSAEVSARQKAEVTLTEIQGQNKRNQEALLAQIHELQDSLGRAEVQSNRKERQLKADITDLQSLLADSESRCDELSNAVSAATRPLLRQMENLQASHSTQQLTWESLEESLTKRLHDAQNAAAISSEKERNTKQQHQAVLSELTNLQAQISSLKAENAELKIKNQELSSRTSQLEQSRNKESSQLEALKASFAEEIGEVKHERDLFEQQLDIERIALSAEKKKNQVLQEQSREKDRRISQQLMAQHPSVEDVNRSTPRSSPTPSLSRVSVSDSLIGSQWGDDVFDPAWSSNRGGNLYDTLRANSAVTVEVLTSTLRQREGELHHVQSELTRHEAQKESLAHELVEASGTVQKLEARLVHQERLQSQFAELEQRYNALLQMYGEKVEEVEELRLDLIDVKEMYKAQIDHLLKK